MGKPCQAVDDISSAMILSECSTTSLKSETRPRALARAADGITYQGLQTILRTSFSLSTQPGDDLSNNEMIGERTM